MHYCFLSCIVSCINFFDIMFLQRCNEYTPCFPRTNGQLDTNARRSCIRAVRDGDADGTGNERGTLELDGTAQCLVLWQSNLMWDSVISVVISVVLVLNKPFGCIFFQNKYFLFFLRKNSNKRPVLSFYTISLEICKDADRMILINNLQLRFIFKRHFIA